MRSSIVEGAGLSPSPYRWSATSTEKMPRVLAAPIRRVTITPLKTSSVPAAAYPPAAPVRFVAAENPRYGNDHSYRKPSCSYTCLIAMALVASPKESLQAGEIYKYIEEVYPYYQNLPKDNWKNSIRHSLSLGHHFHKVQSASGYQGRKGYFWGFVPEKKANIVAEMERFLKLERRSLMKSEKQVPASTSLGELDNILSAVSMSQYMHVHSLPPCSPTTLNRLRQVQLLQKTPQPPPAEPKTIGFQFTSTATVSEVPKANSIVGLCGSNTQSVPAGLPQPENICTTTAGQDKDESPADGTQLVCNLTTTAVQGTTTAVQGMVVDVNKSSTSKSDEVVINGGNAQSSEELGYQCIYRAVKLQDSMSRKRCLDTKDAQPPNETKQIKLSTSESSLSCNASRKRYLDSTEDATTTNASKQSKLTTGLFPSSDDIEELNPMTGFLQEPEKMAMEHYRRSEGFRWLLAFQDELLKDLDSCLPSILQSSGVTDVKASTDHNQDNVTEKTSDGQREALRLQKAMSPGAATADNHDQELNKIGSTRLTTDELLAITNNQGKKPQRTDKKENSCKHHYGESHVSRDAECCENFIFLSGKTYPFAIYNDDISTTLEQATDDKPTVRLSVKGYSLKPDATEIDILVATVHQHSDKLLSMPVKPIQTNIFPGPNVTASILAISSELSADCEFWLAVKQHNSGCHCKQMCLPMGQKQIQVGPWILHPPAISCDNWPEVIWNSQWGVKSFVS